MSPPLLPSTKFTNLRRPAANYASDNGKVHNISSNTMLNTSSISAMGEATGGKKVMVSHRSPVEPSAPKPHVAMPKYRMKMLVINQVGGKKKYPAGRDSFRHKEEVSGRSFMSELQKQESKKNSARFSLYSRSTKNFSKQSNNSARIAPINRYAPYAASASFIAKQTSQRGSGNTSRSASQPLKSVDRVF